MPNIDIEDLLSRLADHHDRLERQQEILMADLSTLQADVEAQTTVIDSAKALLAQLAQKIRDAAGDPAALAQLATDLEANTQGLADAVQANTPDPSSGGGGGQPVDDGPFKDKVAGESFLNYKERLFSYNQAHPDAQVPTESQYGDDRENDWNALPISD